MRIRHESNSDRISDRRYLVEYYFGFLKTRGIVEYSCSQVPEKSSMSREYVYFLCLAPTGSLFSLSSFSHNGGFNTKRSLIKSRGAALQASTEPSVPFLHIPRPFDKNDFICVPRSVLFHARQAGGAGFTFNYSAKHEIPCGIPVSTYSSKAPTAVQVYHAHKARRQPHAGPARTAVPLVQPYLTGCLRFT